MNGFIAQRAATQGSGIALIGGGFRLMRSDC